MNQNHTVKSAMVKQRFNEIDLLRAIACLMVVAFHYFYRGATGGWSPSIQHDGIANIAQYGYLGVHLFFIISGFVIFLSAGESNVAKFVASRISRLYPAFWIAVPLTWLVIFAFNAKSLEVTFTHMLINLTMVPHWFNVPFVDGAYWSLAVELQFYILVGLAIHFKLMHRSELLLGGWLAISLINAIRPMYPVEFWLAANWAPLFCIGASAYLIRTLGFNLSRLAILISGCSLSLFYALKKVANGPNESPFSIAVVAALLTAFFLIFTLIALGKLQFKSYRFITTAGLLTYPLYLLHEFMGYIFISNLNRVIPNTAGCVAIVFTGMLLAAWLLNRYVEKPMAPRLRKRVSDAFKS